MFLNQEQFYIKESYWYNMYSNFSGNFVPQLEEGIERVEWLSCSEIEGALANSYKNIKLLFEAEDLKNITTNYLKDSLMQQTTNSILMVRPVSFKKKLRDSC